MVTSADPIAPVPLAAALRRSRNDAATGVRSTALVAPRPAVPLRTACRRAVLAIAALLAAGGSLPGGPAAAQDAPVRPTVGAAAEPSEADRAALRYFARQGDVDRLEAELRRLRALYPTWSPPRDLLDPDTDDAELQRIYDLVGAQRYDDAQTAIATRQQRDPSFEPPERLAALIELGRAREALRRASDGADWPAVLAVAEANERVLTCDDVDSVWRVAQAFARTGRPQRAYDAYAYVVSNCTDPAQKAASLQKAATELDPSLVTRLFALGGGSAAFTEAQLDIVRGALARAGDVEGAEVPTAWLDLLAEEARTASDLEDAMLVGYYLYRRGLPGEAAQWFRFALDRGLGAVAAEGYIVALRATGDDADEALAREVAYAWREQTPELMEAYLDAVATALTGDDLDVTGISTVGQDIVNRFVPVVIGQRDANGAQALGWYAFNTCQFIIAEEWFLSSANWVPTEAALYGLALTRLRLGDTRGFGEIVDEWGELYRSVRGLVTGAAVDPADPVTGGSDDPTDQVGVQRVVCDPAERTRLRRQIADKQGALSDPLDFTETGSLTSVPPVPLDGPVGNAAEPARPATPRRSVVLPSETPPALFLQVQASPVRQDPAPPTAVRRRPGSVATQQDVEQDGEVVRRVRRGDAVAANDVDAEVRRIVARGSAARAGGSGGSGVQQALAARNYGRCVVLSNRAARSGALSGADAAARGFCLLQVDRPAEAALAFDIAKARSRAGTALRDDAVYGATLAALAKNEAAVAAVAATGAPLSRSRRTELTTDIITQRAVAANRDRRYSEALWALHERAKIAPLQKDLMLLQGFAYRNAGDQRSALLVVGAADAAGRSGRTARALNDIDGGRTFIGELRGGVGNN